MKMVPIYGIRRELSLTQAEFAQLMGKSLRTVQRWEADLMRMDIDAIRQEAEAQGCPLPENDGFKFKPVRNK